MTHMKGFKIRIYPTQDQIEKINNHFGCCRFIWNLMLEIQLDRYKNGEQYLTHYDMDLLLTKIKNEQYPWLKKVNNASLQQVCKDLDIAYIRFFKKISSLPKFKAKKDFSQSYPVRSERFYLKDESHVHIPNVGNVKFKTDFQFPIGFKEKFNNVRVSRFLDKWYVSFSRECDNQVFDNGCGKMGIDLGVKELAVVSFNGTKLTYHNINKTKKVKKMRKRLAQLSKEFRKARNRSFKVRGVKYLSNRLKKMRFKIMRLSRRISDINHNYIHQITNSLISMHPARVVMEDLDVAGLIRTSNKNLKFSIKEQNFGEFRRQMQYKCEWAGIEFVLADRYFPSSQKCSCCGNIKKIRLSDRTYKCDKCGLEIDRDYNSAINLSEYEIH